MSQPATHLWADHLRQLFGHYDADLVRQVASRLIKPRNQWPVEELIARCLETIENAAVIDRRLAELPLAERRLLTLMGHSRQPRWQVGNLLEMLAALGHAQGVKPILHLFEAGLLYPELTHETEKLSDFEQWLGQGRAVGFAVYAPPSVTARALGESLGLPECPGATTATTAPREADGLEWPLRLAVAWQRVGENPSRLNMQGGFFKRDLDRLRADPILTGVGGDQLVEIPDPGMLAVVFAEVQGLIVRNQEELAAGSFPVTGEVGLFDSIETLWASLPRLEAWNPQDGWTGSPETGNPFPATYLLAFLLLSRLGEKEWARPGEVEQWIIQHHPYWQGTSATTQRNGKENTPLTGRGPLSTFLLGLAFPLRLVQAAKDNEGIWVVRLSGLGRWLLGLAAAPPLAPPFTKTVLVQPNLEIVAYRQGLTPELIAALSHFAVWTGLGSACTLQLKPETVYRALEAGWSFESLVQALEKHGMRPVPPAVVESLRTWSNKRDRLSVYPAAALFEFPKASDLDDALARGLPAIRISDRLAVVPNEASIDYRHFRLSSTRDYGLPPDQCVAVEPDGVTLTIDPVRADLLLETELRRFAEPMDWLRPNGGQQYRLTPASLERARQGGMSLRHFDDWFLQRTGGDVPPAVRLLLSGAEILPLQVRREVVLYVASADVADGILQWPGTHDLVQARLGPTALAVRPEHLQELKANLEALGLIVEVE